MQSSRCCSRSAWKMVEKGQKRVEKKCGESEKSERKSHLVKRVEAGDATGRADITVDERAAEAVRAVPSHVVLAELVPVAFVPRRLRRAAVHAIHASIRSASGGSTTGCVESVLFRFEHLLEGAARAYPTIPINLESTTQGKTQKIRGQLSINVENWYLTSPPRTRTRRPPRMT